MQVQTQTVKEITTIATLLNYLYGVYRSLDFAYQLLDLIPDQEEREEVLSLSLSQFEQKYGLTLLFSHE